MKGRYPGLWVPDRLFQAMWQDAEFFSRHRIDRLKSVFFYFTACDPAGNPVTIRDELGAHVDGYETSGGYHCAADHYDTHLLPQTIIRPN